MFFPFHRLRKWQQVKATIIVATLFTPATPLLAASCCGGGSGGSLILPKMSSAMFDMSASQENYNGFWQADGTILQDPPGSDLKQLRLNVGAAYRLAPNWQTSFVLPYVWNRNQYSGYEHNSNGLGDSSFSLLYEAFDDITCVWKVRELSDLKPAIYWGATLTVPTGISPYDDVPNKLDTTGLGFYRLDGSLHVEKTIYPLTASLTLNHGIHIKRPVNRERGEHVKPYNKQLGDRTSVTTSFSYTHFMDSLDAITAGFSYNYLTEGKTVTDGTEDSASGFRKQSISTSLTWAESGNRWITRVSWNHSINREGWGENFPITDIYTLGVSYLYE